MPRAGEYDDLTGREMAGRYVIGLADGHARASRDRHWRCVCLGCARVAVVRGSYLRQGKGCPSCKMAAAYAASGAMRQAVRETAARNNARSHPHVCLECGDDFLGTARQQYCANRCQQAGARRRAAGRKRAKSAAAWPDIPDAIP